MRNEELYKPLIYHGEETFVKGSTTIESISI